MASNNINNNPLRDPETIAYACPQYKKYTRTLILLGILIFFLIPFALLIPPIGIVLLIIDIVGFIVVLRKSMAFLKTTQEEIIANGYTAAWWNEKNKSYRKAFKQAQKNSASLNNANSSTPRGNSNASNNSAGNTVAKAVVGATAAYATGKVAGNAIRKTNDKYRERMQKNNEAFQKQLNYSNDHPRATQTKEKITSKGKTYTLTTMPNGNQDLSDASGRRIGQYRKSENKTYGKDGRFVGNGNLIRTLI